ncbi:MAG: hypothetical protein N2646_07390 [Bellilinea sp.]|nr:hypothetical protein [Bellilinea sp.]
MSLDVKPPDLSRYRNMLRDLTTVQVAGRVTQVIGLTIEVVGLNCQIGEVCEIQANHGGRLQAEVIGFRNERMLLMPLGTMEGIQPDSLVRPHILGMLRHS